MIIVNIVGLMMKFIFFPYWECYIVDQQNILIMKNGPLQIYIIINVRLLLQMHK